MSFERLDINTINDDPEAICCFSVMRNEITRLPYWLRYYREQGVNQFFVVDNGSNDGTVELLAKQGDCILFQTFESYARSRCGVEWLNHMMDQYGKGRWSLVVDVDELLVYSPDYGRVLPELVRHLEAEQAEGVFALMVDMYATRPLKDLEYKPGDPPSSVCNSFDARPYETLPANDCPYVVVVGGVRQRLFYPEFSRRSLGDEISWKTARLLTKIPSLAGSRWVKSMSFCRPPVISKVPFVKALKGRAHISGAHTITPTRLFHARCALLHFKFLDDFHKKSIEEVKRNEHYDSAREYKRYLAFLNKNPNFSFKGENTLVYQGPQTLVAAGLIQGKNARSFPTDMSGLK